MNDNLPRGYVGMMNGTMCSCTCGASGRWVSVRQPEDETIFDNVVFYNNNTEQVECRECWP